MSKFHLTIKNNGTGETLVDIDTSAIIGVYVNGDYVARMEAIEDTGRVVGRVLYALDKALHEAKQNYPSAMLSYMMSKLADEQGEIDEEEETVEC